MEILKYLNEKRVVHNDIKPANLFLRGAEIFVSGKLDKFVEIIPGRVL